MKLTESFLKALVEEQFRKLMLAEEEEEKDSITFKDVVKAINAGEGSSEVHSKLDRYISKMEKSDDPKKEHHISRAKERTKELLKMRKDNKKQND